MYTELIKGEEGEGFVSAFIYPDTPNTVTITIGGSDSKVFSKNELGDLIVKLKGIHDGL